MQTLYEVLRQFWVVWLMIIFIGIVAWAFWPSNKDELESHGDIPLRDEEKDGEH